MVSPFCGNQSNLPWPQTLAKQSIAQTCIFPNFLALCLDFTKIPACSVQPRQSQPLGSLSGL